MPVSRVPRVVARFGTLFAVMALSLAALGCSGSSGCGDKPDGCLRVLFLGNSYTQVNDLPDTFAALARAGGHRVEVAMVAPGGQTLAGHASAADTQAQLVPNRWDVVVL